MDNPTNQPPEPSSPQEAASRLQQMLGDREWGAKALTAGSAEAVQLDRWQRLSVNAPPAEAPKPPPAEPRRPQEPTPQELNPQGGQDWERSVPGADASYAWNFGRTLEADQAELVDEAETGLKSAGVTRQEFGVVQEFLDRDYQKFQTMEATDLYRHQDDTFDRLEKTLGADADRLLTNAGRVFAEIERDHPKLANQVAWAKFSFAAWMTAIDIARRRWG